MKNKGDGVWQVSFKGTSREETEKRLKTFDGEMGVTGTDASALPSKKIDYGFSKLQGQLNSQRAGE